ncbi:MAG: EAL domain-containing protein [Gammaproteobacteria bacterium]
MFSTDDKSFNQLFKAHPIPMWVYDLETLAFLAVNSAAVAHYGYSEEEFLRLTIRDLRPDDELARLEANLATAPRQGLERSGVWRHRRRDGRIIDVEISSHPLQFHGRACKFVLAHDVTDRVESERKVARLNRVYALLSGINSAIVRIRERVSLFREACRLATHEGGFCGASIASVRGDGAVHRFEAEAGRPLPVLPLDQQRNSPTQRVAREHNTIVCNDVQADPELAALAVGGVRAVAAFPLMLGNRVAAVLTLSSETAGVFDADEMRLLHELAGDLAFALLFFDREEQISYLAHHDVMTSLPNRRLFLDRLSQLLHPGGGSVAMVLLNLDRFAQLNDALGRHAGDALLGQIARRLSHRLPESYNVARIGGDTFALAIPELARAVDAVQRLEEAVFAALDQPYMIGSQEVRVSIRAGLALFPADGVDAETLFTRAEAALKNARTHGERYLFYAPHMNAAMAERVALEHQLRNALAAQEFVMMYQPRVDLNTGRIVSAEALVRWNHPQRGLIGPADFILLAEETGLIRALGAWVINAVCAQQRAWINAHTSIVPVAVNLSAVQCAHTELLSTIGEAIKRRELSDGLIEFELTETAVMTNPDAAASNLLALKKLGVQLSLDDFGTGYSSLAQLKRYPFDVVKIDRSFISGVDTNVEDKAIAAAIIAMAHSLGLRVVAEGVETQAQLDMLRSLKCDELQGFYFSRPITADEFAELLREDRRLVA